VKTGKTGGPAGSRRFVGTVVARWGDGQVLLINKKGDDRFLFVVGRITSQEENAAEAGEPVVKRDARWIKDVKLTALVTLPQGRSYGMGDEVEVEIPAGTLLIVGPAVGRAPGGMRLSLKTAAVWAMLIVLFLMVYSLFSRR
jgi:ribose 1,5-bisphosphokinase PhnN